MTVANCRSLWALDLGEKKGPFSLRREKYLQRVVDDIEIGRINRTYSSFATPRNASDSSSRKSLLNDKTRSKSSRETQSHTAFISHSRASPSYLSSQKLHSTGLGRHKDENFRYGMASKTGKYSQRKLPRITLKCPSNDEMNSTTDYHLLRVPFSQSSSARQGPLASSGPFYGFRSRSSSPSDPRHDPDPSDIFTWKICTPTNWKRGKSDRQILLERKLLRRKGRQPTQTKFISLFKMKDSDKLSAADRIRRVLKRAQFYGDDIKRLPLVRFRRAVRTLIAFLKTVKLSRDKGKGTEPTTWIDEDDIRASKRAYESFGVSFDVFSYRAKREIQISNEARAILSMAPGSRSADQRHMALVSLSQAVPEFGEFPIAMQEALVRVGWYENFEARRIIIREGHMADNFYLILSGSAVVTIREQNGMGDYFGRTVAVLQRGNSFGELALIYGGTRSATVTCKDNVELLAVGRDDYIDIFMHKTKDGSEPEHIKFLKQIKLFCGWPIHTLPLDDPSIFLYTYVRRGVVLCKDSNQSEWIYVIKSGSCRVLTALHAVKPSIPLPDRLDLVKEGTLIKNREELNHSPLVSPRLCPLRHRQTDAKSRDQSEGRSHDAIVRGPREMCAHAFTSAFKLPSITSRSDLEVQEAAEKHQQQLNQIMTKRNIDQPTLVTELSKNSNEELQDCTDQTKPRSKSDRIFVNLLTLQAKDVYGLESVVLSVFKEPTRTSLVSDGAECIMISKKFFQQKLTEDVAKKIRKEIRPLPSQEVLQDKLQTKTNWDLYRAITVANFIDFRKQLNGLNDL